MPYTLYRAIRGQQPRLADFWSDFAHGERPLPSQLRELMMWAGVSMFSAVGNAAGAARGWRRGHYLAEVVIPNDSEVLVRQTGRRDPTHHSVMGTPATLLALVNAEHILPVAEIRIGHVGYSASVTFFELVNLSSGNRIGEYDTEGDALSDLRDVLQRRGERALDGIGLCVVEDDGPGKLLADGPALASRASETAGSGKQPTID